MTRIAMDMNDIDLSTDCITPKAVFNRRREWMKAVAAGGVGSWLSQGAFAMEAIKLASTPNVNYPASLGVTPYKSATTYNNFYEFGTDKADPAQYAGALQTRPWTMTIGGLVKKPLTLDIDSLLKIAPLEERIYRMRCVEGWSMVIPWDGYSLSKLLAKVEPLGSAKYIEFISLADSKQMPGVKDAVIDWPYREGLRLDEAMNPLTLLTFGMYGEPLPRQNGAPVRIVVPWKYGFKSAKSIISMRLTAEMPKTSWSQINPREYGFYSNVNPLVDHPRWSQATERRIGDPRGVFAPKIKTELFNGYGDQVASLYAGMDLKKYY